MKKILNLLFSLPLLLLTAWPAASQADEFLDPEEAFKFSARTVDAQNIEVHFKIVEGYYLYKDKFKFSLIDAKNGLKLDKPVFPKAETKDDPTFGSVEIYKHEAVIKLPLIRKPGAASTIEMQATYQGCAAGGVCYMPISSVVKLKLPALEAPKEAAQPAPKAGPATLAALEPIQSQSADALSGLRTLGGDSGQDDFLPPDQAFQASASLKDAQTLQVQYKVAEGCYLYRGKLVYNIKSPADIQAGKAITPTPDVKEDPNFGRTEIYHHDFTVDVPLSRALKPGEALTVELTYQGCSEKGICYPPITTPQTVTAGQQGAEMTAAPAEKADIGDASSIESTLKNGGLWVAIAAFFGFGLALSLTPCVFPMIPILSGIIAGQKTVTRSSSFLLSLSYVLGMAITYAIVGIIAAKSGTLLSNALQNPIALGFGAAIFVALALSMFGFYDLQLPSALQSKLTETSNKLHGGHITGVFGMGALSALIVGPCVAPPLAAALAYIAQTGDSLKGGLSLFSLAMGMGVPLLLVGLSAGTLLPKAGAWMNGVKYFFGVAMLGVAIWLISPFLAPWVHIALWSTLLIISAVYLHALDPLPHHAGGWQRLWKGVGVVALIAGLGMLLGALGGSRDILQPLSIYQRTVTGQTGTAAAAAEIGPGLAFEKIADVSELDRRLAAAKAGKQEVMLDFFADWCVSCKEMEKFTFSDAAVKARLKNTILLQADVTSNSPEAKALLKRFGLFGPPGMIFWDAQGQQSEFKVIGFEEAPKFLDSLDKAFK